eukprot:scpid7568/ scgid24007/ 
MYLKRANIGVQMIILMHRFRLLHCLHCKKMKFPSCRVCRIDDVVRAATDRWDRLALGILQQYSQHCRRSSDFGTFTGGAGLGSGSSSMMTGRALNVTCHC